jgi:hypothetical protein
MELEERIRLLQEIGADKAEDDEIDSGACARYQDLAETIRSWDVKNAKLSSAFGQSKVCSYNAIRLVFILHSSSITSCLHHSLSTTSLEKNPSGRRPQVTLPHNPSGQKMLLIEQMTLVRTIVTYVLTFCSSSFSQNSRLKLAADYLPKRTGFKFYSRNTIKPSKT